MQEIYEAHFVDLEYDENEFVFTGGHEDTSDSAQAIKEHITQTFPTLKNPFSGHVRLPALEPRRRHSYTGILDDLSTLRQNRIRTTWRRG